MKNSRMCVCVYRCYDWKPLKVIIGQNLNIWWDVGGGALYSYIKRCSRKWLDFGRWVYGTKVYPLVVFLAADFSLAHNV